VLVTLSLELSLALVLGSLLLGAGGVGRGLCRALSGLTRRADLGRGTVDLLLTLTSVGAG
jgi:hypothetical protein